MARAVKVFRALGDPTRYRIVRLLAEREEMSCAELSSLLSLSRPALSYHFRVLENAGLLLSRKEGPFVFFRLNRPWLHRFIPGFESAHLYPQTPERR